MKQALVIGVLLMMLNPLVGASMKANSIGQPLGAYEEGDRYRLELSSYSRILYDDGKQVWMEIDQYIGPATRPRPERIGMDAYKTDVHRWLPCQGTGRFDDKHVYVG